MFQKSGGNEMDALSFNPMDDDIPGDYVVIPDVTPKELPEWLGQETEEI